MSHETFGCSPTLEKVTKSADRTAEDEEEIQRTGHSRL